MRAFALVQGTTRLSICALLLLISYARPNAAVEPAPFPLASARFEQNVTDGDVEVVFEAAGDDDGFANFRVVGPDGRTVIDFNAPDPSTLGIRHFHMESPEPKDVEALKAAYPEGTYSFSGTTFSGDTLAGESELSHRLPATAEITQPQSDADNVAVIGARITWDPVPSAAQYIVEIEQDAEGTRVEAVVSGNATSFAVPDGFLEPNTEYDLAIGTVSKAGNISFVETSFATAE